MNNNNIDDLNDVEQDVENNKDSTIVTSTYNNKTITTMIDTNSVCTYHSNSLLHSIAEASDEEKSLDDQDGIYCLPMYNKNYSLGAINPEVQHVFRCTSLNCYACRRRSRSASPRVRFIPVFDGVTAEI